MRFLYLADITQDIGGRRYLRYVIEAADAGNARAKLAVDVFVTVRVIPTDEELGIARRTYELV